jgi:hypothetical protein
MYVVGASSGYFSVTTQEEKIHLFGLFKKAQSSITKGVTFVQLDLESVAEFEEPNLKMNMENDIKKKLGITFGVHSETKAAGVEAAELDSAIGIEYERAHKRIIDILEKSAEIGSKYVLVHASESDPFPLLSLKTQPSDLVDIWGRPFKDFLDEEKNKWLLEWIMENGSFIWVEILGRRLDEYKEYTKEARIRDYKTSLRARGEPEKDPPQEWLDEQWREEIESLKRYFKDQVSSKALHYGPERWVYFLIAKWMEKNNDILWKEINDASIAFFAKRAGMTIEQWKSEKKITTYSIDDENFRSMHEIWVPAVAAKYIWGHFHPIKERFPDPKKIIRNAKMPFVLESPMGGRGIEEWLRLANPYQYYFLCKEVGFDCMQLALDFEHMLSIRLDPETIISLFPEDGGKYVKVIHAGWPGTLAPAHFPIQLGSDQELYLYKMYYKLREKGFGTDPNNDHYIVFERAGPETFIESIISLKLIAEFLSKGTPPENLPPKFFGVAAGEIASYERQWQIIEDHARDPLKGLMMIPEEEHGVLGKAAVEKGKAEQWKKEELR